MSRTEDLYFDSLCRLLNANTKDREVLRTLHGLNFYYSIEMDENRELDGLSLRDWFDESYIHMQIPLMTLSNKKCSVLEMIIGVSNRIFYMLNGWNPITLKDIFWRLIDNINYGNPVKSEKDLIRNIERLLNRQYHPNGDGGMFPLEDPKEDQRMVEIWYQMQAYIQEIM